MKVTGLVYAKHLTYTAKYVHYVMSDGLSGEAWCPFIVQEHFSIFVCDVIRVAVHDWLGDA